MSKIIATDHFETSNWEVTFEDLASHYADLFIGFTDDAPVVEFKDLKFKYELKQDGNIKQYGVFPPPGVKYVRTDQPYIVVERLNLELEVLELNHRSIVSEANEQIGIVRRKVFKGHFPVLSFKMVCCNNFAHVCLSYSVPYDDDAGAAIPRIRGRAGVA